MKLLSIFLTLNSICGTIFLSKNIEINALRKEEYKTKTLYSSDFTNKYYCYEYNQGYEIVDASTNNIIEFSPSSISPYINYSTNSTLIYNGPMSYGFKNIDIKNAKRIKNITSNFESSSKIIHPVSNFSYNYDTEIDNSNILANLNDFTCSDGKEYNNIGTCGYLSAAMILYYSKYQFNDDFVSNNYIEYKNGNKRFKVELHDELYNIGLSLGKKSSTTAFDIKDVMSEYCKRKGINSNHYAMLLSTVANINMCIQDNKPIALFGNFVRPDNGKKVNHAVTCYGTRDVPLGQGQTNRYFIVNFGWTGYSRVYLLDNIFRNPVGSMYNMNY